MMHRLAWCAVILLPITVLGGLWAARRDLAQPNRVWPTQMAVSPAYASQTANPVLPHGLTTQLPVEGTLARGAWSFPYDATDADRWRAGEELVNPLLPTSPNLREGQRIYETFCLPCHGVAGHGDGPIIPKFPNPPDFHSEQSRGLRDGEMFHIVTLGRRQMAAYAAQLSWKERWQVILYIRTLQQQS